MDPLSADGRQALLRLARGAILAALQADDALFRTLERTEITAELDEPRGAFVTLKQAAGGAGPALRGCIGSVLAGRPLYRRVIELAPKAAFEDPRFPPLSSAELERTRIEISALGAPRRLDRLQELVIGRHGAMLTRGVARAVFLPQVAAELGWTAKQFLEQLAVKAGLDENDWREAEVAVFEADAFSE